MSSLLLHLTDNSLAVADRRESAAMGQIIVELDVHQNVTLWQCADSTVRMLICLVE
jgi:hypothetical protein